MTKRIALKYGEGRRRPSSSSSSGTGKPHNRSRINILVAGRALSIKPSEAVLNKFALEGWARFNIEYVHTDSHGWTIEVSKSARDDTGYKLRSPKASVQDIKVPVRGGLTATAVKGDPYCNDQILPNKVIFFMPTSVTLTDNVVELKNKA